MTISQTFSPQLARVSRTTDSSSSYTASTATTDSLHIGSSHSAQQQTITQKQNVVVNLSPSSSSTSSSTMSVSNSSSSVTTEKITKVVRFSAHLKSFSTTVTLIESVDDDFFSNETRRCELWWTPKELKANSIRRRATVKQFIADQEQLEQEDPQQQKEIDENDSFSTCCSTSTTTCSVVDKKLATLYKQCSTFNVSQVLRHKANKQILFDMVTTDVRGLEPKLCRSIRQHRRQHAQSIVSLMKRQRRRRHDKAENDETTTTSTTTSIEYFLSTKSAESSRKSQIFARLLAQVDAKESQQVQEQQKQQQ